MPSTGLQRAGPAGPSRARCRGRTPATRPGPGRWPAHAPLGGPPGRVRQRKLPAPLFASTYMESICGPRARIQAPPPPAAPAARSQQPFWNIPCPSQPLCLCMGCSHHQMRPSLQAGLGASPPAFPSLQKHLPSVQCRVHTGAQGWGRSSAPPPPPSVSPKARTPEDVCWQPWASKGRLRTSRPRQVLGGLVSGGAVHTRRECRHKSATIWKLPPPPPQQRARHSSCSCHQTVRPHHAHLHSGSARACPPPSTGRDGAPGSGQHIVPRGSGRARRGPGARLPPPPGSGPGKEATMGPFSALVD